MACRTVLGTWERAFRFSIPLFEGVAKVALYCVHRTSTFLSCAFCEQEGHLAAPSPSSATARSASKEETKGSGAFVLRPGARRIREKIRFQNHFAARETGAGAITVFGNPCELSLPGS